MVRLEPIPRFQRSSVKNNHLKRSHQCRHIRLAVKPRARPMINFHIFILLVIEQPDHLTAVSVSQRNGKRSEVLMKRLVGQVLIRIEVIRIVVRSRSGVRADPVEFVLDNLDSPSIDLVF